MSAAVDSLQEDVVRPPQVNRWTRNRKIGYALVGLWILIGVGLVVYLFAAWNPELIERYFPAYMKGLATTIKLVILSIIA
ncbi:MAG: amino acid ABC transporter permease, partial [Rhizobiaceae bacterium]|nr:amino acid ABC transporter permease [Rhizobiaceae bacterium]